MPRVKAKEKTSELGQRLIDELQMLCDAMAKGGMEEVEKHFRVTRVPIPPLESKDIAEVRKRIGATQAVLAMFLGVPPSTVRAWERESEELPPTARKFIAEMRYNSDYWRQRVKAAIANAKRSR